MRQRRIWCDICDKEIGYSQYLLKIPVAARLFQGSYGIGMRRVDICDGCMNRMLRVVRERIGEDEQHE